MGRSGVRAYQQLPGDPQRPVVIQLDFVQLEFDELEFDDLWALNS